MFETLFKTTPTETPVAEAPLLYTQRDDGTFQEQMDVIYAPGTVFYTQSPDGSFEPVADWNTDVAQETPQVTEEFVITTAVNFLRAKGYTVAAENEIKPGSNLEHAIEISLMLDQLRGMAISHVSNRASIDDMCELIGKIKALV